MKSRKIIITIVVSVIIVLALGIIQFTRKGDSKDSMRIAFIPQLTGIPYFTAMEEGGKTAASQLGGEFLYVGATTASSAEQVRLMENLITQKVDAISVSVLDSKSINPVIKKAKEAGIAVFTSDSDSPTSERDVFIAQSTDEDLGRTLMVRLAKQIGESGQVGIISGESTATNLNSWISYMKKEAEENHPDVDIVDTRFTSGGSSEDAFKQAQELMTRYPNIKGLIAVASTTVPGVARAIEQASKIGEVRVIGYGSPATVKPFVDSGVMQESILWDPKALGYLTHWAGVQLVNNIGFRESNEVPGLDEPVRYFEDTKTLLLGSPLIISKDNINDFNF